MLKATEHIAAGHEIFVSYGGPDWFEDKNLPYIDVDYARTQWRPELHPLPCRQDVVQRTGADGTRSYVVLAAVSSGTGLDISPCLEVPANVVDDSPYLRDSTLNGHVANMSQPAHTPTISLLSADPRDERTTGERPESVLHHTALLTHFPCCDALDTHTSRDSSTWFPH